MKHTPGPWVADSFPTYGHPANLTPNITINPVILGVAVNLPIAKVPRKSEEHAANARLIAAAPDLLEALKGVEARCKSSGYVGQDGQYLKAISAAIAKATGA